MCNDAVPAHDGFQLGRSDCDVGGGVDNDATLCARCTLDVAQALVRVGCENAQAMLSRRAAAARRFANALHNSANVWPTLQQQQQPSVNFRPTTGTGHGRGQRRRWGVGDSKGTVSSRAVRVDN